MGITFIVLCILCLAVAVLNITGNRRAAVNAEIAKVWVGIAAVILALGHFWPS